MNSSRNLPKVFCLGLSKTGTTSLGKYFCDLGYSVCHENVNQERNIKTIIEFCDEKVDQYDMFQDLPWPATFERYIINIPTQNLF